jgi:hypothetical protein
VSTPILSRSDAALAARKQKKHSDLSEWQFQPSPQKSSWVLLRKTKEKIARLGEISSKDSFLVRMYDEARTYFEQNG